jgi:uncharacterized lipoprotein YmbA
MRKVALAVLALIPALTLAACASDGRPSASTTQLDRLRRDCEAKGGMLVPSGRLTGEVALDNPCRLHDATNLPAR